MPSLDKFINKWRNLKSRAAYSNIGCSLTLDQYKQLASEAGITADQIGRGINQYHMGRIGDTGDYVLGNCRFITHKQNQLEKVMNGRTTLGHTKETHQHIARMAETKSGRTKDNFDYLRRHSETLSSRNKETHDYIKSQAHKVSKSFELIDPDGNVHLGRNLYQFSKNHGLTNSLISMVCAGTKKQYKGWTGRYIDDSNFV